MLQYHKILSIHGGVTKKEGEVIFEMKIPNILNTNSTKIVRNFLRAKRKLQHIKKSRGTFSSPQLITIKI
jgi:hypothetical protein